MITIEADIAVIMMNGTWQADQVEFQYNPDINSDEYKLKSYAEFLYRQQKNYFGDKTPEDILGIKCYLLRCSDA